MRNNKSFIAKADLEVSDLIADGGYLQAEQAEKFILKVIEEAVFLKMIQVVGMKSHTKLLDKIGIDGWVLKPGTSGAALAYADRTKPVTEQVTLNTALMKGEIRLNEETIEDNIEGGNFKNTVMAKMAEHVALDMDKVAVNGNTSGTTGTVLDLIDGARVSATSHVVNKLDNTIDKAVLKQMLKDMPSGYNRNKAKQRFMTSEDAELDYRDYLSDRMGAVGDKFVLGDDAVRYGNRPIIPVPVFPEDVGTSNHCTDILLTDPKNAMWGVWRKVKVKTDEDITTGEWIMVTTVRCGFVYVEEDAVVKAINVKVVS